MIHLLKRKKYYRVLFFVFILPFTSCKTAQNVIYFSDVPDSVKNQKVTLTEFKEPVIQVDDILSITIQTVDPQASAALNQSAGSTASASGQAAPSGFLVGKRGNVEIPILGMIKLEGLTTAEAREVVRKEAGKYFKNPTVQVRFANFRVTLIGEVNKPAAYILPNEKVSILDAIGMAGDLTIYGRRENVMLIRDNEGKKEMVRLDLTSSSLLKSPYFYLKQNDVIYVEPGKARIAANNAARTQALGIGISVITLLVTVLSRF